MAARRCSICNGTDDLYSENDFSDSICKRVKKKLRPFLENWAYAQYTRLAGLEEVIPDPDVSQSFESIEAKNIKDSVKASLLDVKFLKLLTHIVQGDRASYKYYNGSGEFKVFCLSLVSTVRMVIQD
ncbi:hypothetical protein L2E82_08699 [Cichorium intybus]|uniref:Uncharacterized protein n=1 Tax=Cichorium intybus TaxID=13427 RepID=A0ACB9G6V4_CICIN|nr:hypothetical protein L2E82_08699 [Cichorium intybus]